MKFMFASDKPRKEKTISSHLVIGTISKCSLKSSMLSKEPVFEVHPESKLKIPLSTNE